MARLSTSGRPSGQGTHAGHWALCSSTAGILPAPLPLRRQHQASRQDPPPGARPGAAARRVIANAGTSDRHDRLPRDADGPYLVGGSTAIADRAVLVIRANRGIGQALVAEAFLPLLTRSGDAIVNVLWEAKV
jgi:glutathione S-transferase